MKVKFTDLGTGFICLVLAFAAVVCFMHIDSSKFKHYTGKCQLITEKKPPHTNAFNTNTIYGGRCEYETKAGNLQWENIYVIGICRLNKRCVLNAIDEVRYKEELNKAKAEITYEDI